MRGKPVVFVIDYSTGVAWIGRIRGLTPFKPLKLAGNPGGQTLLFSVVECGSSFGKRRIHLKWWHTNSLIKPLIFRLHLSRDYLTISLFVENQVMSVCLSFFGWLKTTWIQDVAVFPNSLLILLITSDHEDLWSKVKPTSVRVLQSLPLLRSKSFGSLRF